jgi:hypothetical protein
MGGKWDSRYVRRSMPRGASRRSRIRADLESRGVAPEFSQPVALRLESIASDLSPDEYAAVLNGVATAYGVHREDREGPRESASDVDEIQRLMQDFASELRKLEEGLQILSAYLCRMRNRAVREPSHTVH